MQQPSSTRNSPLNQQPSTKHQEQQHTLPRVSLITACYNSESTIHRTLASVASQKGEYELEHVIQDGGSSDTTLNIISEYSDDVLSSSGLVRSEKLDSVPSAEGLVPSDEKTGDSDLNQDSETKYQARRTKSREPSPKISELRTKPRLSVSLKSEKDDGFYDAINKGIARAKGDIIGLINADDWLADERILADIVKLFEENPEIDAVYGDLDYVTVEDRDISKNRRVKVGKCESAEVEEANSEKTPLTFNLLPFTQPHSVRRHWVSGSYTISSFKNGWMPPHPTVYVRREVFEKYGAYRLDMGTAADYEWMLRIFVKEQIKAAYLPRVSVKMLQGGISNESFTARLKANKSDRNAWEVNGLKPYPWFALAKPLRKLKQFF